MSSAPSPIPRRGMCLILSSPSGAGKTTLARALLESDGCLFNSVSMTTRPPRMGETEGVDYFFVSRERFESLRGQGELLEWAEVFGNLYGTPAGRVKQQLEEGKDILFDVDWQGAARIASLLPADTVRVFILPPSAEELSRRIYTRGTDAARVTEYDYVIVNRDVQESLAALRAILEAERHKCHRQRGLAGFVAKLTSSPVPAACPGNGPA
jgi:guanylate kinase